LPFLKSFWTQITKSHKKRRPHKWTPPNPKESNYEKINQLLIFTLEEDFLLQILRNIFLFPTIANLLKLVFDLQVFFKIFYIIKERFPGCLHILSRNKATGINSKKKGFYRI
jgi:hypothetical protein